MFYISLPKEKSTDSIIMGNVDQVNTVYYSYYIVKCQLNVNSSFKAGSLF